MLAEREPGRDRRIAQPVRDQREHLPLTPAERRQVGLGRGGRARGCRCCSSTTARSRTLVHRVDGHDAVVEAAQPRTGGQIAHHTGDEDLAGAGKGGNALGDVHGEPHGRNAAHVDLAGDAVQVLDPLGPEPVAEPCRGALGADERRDQQRRQHPIGVGGAARGGEELLNRIHHAVDVAGPDRVVAPAELDEARARVALGEKASGGKPHARILAPMQHHGGHADCAEHAAHVDRRVHLRECDRRSRADRGALEPRPPGAEMRVVHAAGREARERGAGPPALFRAAHEGGEPLGAQHCIVEMRIAAVQHQRACALGKGGGEGDRHRRALGGAEQHGAPAAGRVHHRAHVVHTRLQVRQVLHIHAVGEPGAALVEMDHPREGREAA